MKDGPTILIVGATDEQGDTLADYLAEWNLEKAAISPKHTAVNIPASGPALPTKK
jgi:hypothetical protein